MEQTFFVFGHHVRPYGEIGRTISKFGRTMSDDRLLFPALGKSRFQLPLGIQNFSLTSQAYDKLNAVSVVT